MTVLSVVQPPQTDSKGVISSGEGLTILGSMCGRKCITREVVKCGTRPSDNATHASIDQTAQMLLEKLNQILV